MNRYIILLVASALTIPAVAAEPVSLGPASCDVDTESGDCRLEAPTEGLNGPEETRKECPSVDLTYNIKNWYPVGATPHLECI